MRPRLIRLWEHETWPAHERNPSASGFTSKLSCSYAPVSLISATIPQLSVMSNSMFSISDSESSIGLSLPPSMASTDGDNSAPAFKTHGNTAPRRTDVTTRSQHVRAGNGAPDALSYIEIAFNTSVPVITLNIRTGLTPGGVKGYFCLGMGRSSLLEPHRLGKREMKHLQQQKSPIEGPLVGLKRNVGPPNRHESLRSFRQELRILRHTSLKHHTNIIKLLFVGFDAIDSPVLGFELAAFGNLGDVLLSGVLPEDETLALDLVLDVALGLTALHTNGIAHGDVKPANVLVCNHPERKAIAKVADFSDSVFVQDFVGREWYPLGGTHAWRAPECYGAAGHIYDPLKTDIFSFGLCALAVIAPGEGYAFGSPADCFLDRVFPGRDRVRELRDVKLLANSRVIDMASRWAEETCQSSTINELAQTLSLVCLSSLPDRRLDIVSIATIINDSEARSWKSRSARRLSRSSTIRKDIDVLEELLQLDLRVGKHDREKNFLFTPDARLTGVTGGVQQHLVQRLTIAADEIDEDLIPLIDEAFLDGDFSLEDLNHAFQSSTTLSPTPIMKEATIMRAHRALGTLAWCYCGAFATSRQKDNKTIISTLVKHLAKAGRVGNPEVVMLYLNVTRHLEQPEIQVPYAPRRLWMAWGCLHGNWEARDALRIVDQRLYSKIAHMAVTRQGPLRQDSEPTDAVKRLLEVSLSQGDELTDVFTPDGHHTLDLAIYNGNIDLVRKIVEDIGFDIEVSSRRIGPMASVFDDGNVTPIMVAAFIAHLEIFNFLLSKKPDLSGTTLLGANVLHYIAWFPDQIAANLAPELVSRGASLNAIATSHRSNITTPGPPRGSPCRWAAELGKKHFVRALVNLHRVNETKVPDLDEALRRAVQDFDVPLCSLLLDNFPVLHPSNAPPSAETLGELLRDSVTPCPMTCPPLAKHGIASPERQADMAKYLLKRGAWPSSEKSACRPGGSKTTESGNRDSFSTDRSSTILTQAIVGGCAEAICVMVEHLQSQGCDLNEVLGSAGFNGGSSAIVRAIFNNQQIVFDYLLTLVKSKQLDLSNTDKMGQTALHVAAAQPDNPHYVQVLLEHGLKPHAENKGGHTPFGLAVTSHNFEGAEMMLNSPMFKNASAFEMKNRHGFLICEWEICSSLMALRNECEIHEVEFYERVGAMRPALERPKILWELARGWPSTREELRGFNSWLLDWLLERMPADQINQHDEFGYTALHWMGFRGSFDGVVAMLQCDKTDRMALTKDHNMTLFDCIFLECAPPFDARLIQGGARELRGFEGRIKRLAELLLTTEISLKCFPGSSREDMAKRELKQLTERVGETLAEARSTSGPNAEARIFETAIWPQVIPVSQQEEED